MKKITYILALSISAILALTLTVNYWLYTAPPQSVNEAENALATKDVIALGYVNNTRINTILDTVGSDPQSLELPVLEDNLFSVLYYGESNLKTNLKQLVYSINVAEQASYNLILQGQFDWLLLSKDIDKYYQIKTLADNTYHLTERAVDDDTFICPDEKAKQVKKQFYLFADKQWLIISNNQLRLNHISDRLFTKQAAEIDLNNWREYRNQYLASSALFVPEKAAKATSGFTYMMVRSVVKANAEISSIYAGIDLNLMERGINLNSQVNADASWVSKTQQATQLYLEKKQQEVADLSPALASLLNNFSVEAQQDSLLANLILKESDINKLGDALGELIASMFNMGGKQEEKIVKESIQESPWDYQMNNQFATLSDFKGSGSFEKPAIVDGPLAMSFYKAKIEETTGLLSIGVRAGATIPKISDWWQNSEVALALQIDSVIDKNGQEMMRDERCIKDLYFKNSDVSAGYSVNNEVVSTNKSVRLNSGSQLKDVANIKGTFSVSIPTEITAVDIGLKKGAFYEAYGFRFFLAEVGQQQISYQLSGDKARLIEIRAYNKNGNALSEGSFSGFSNNKKVVFKGDIAKLQLFVAGKINNHKTDFNLSADQFFSDQKISEYYLTNRPSTLTKAQWLNNIPEKISEESVMAYLSKGYSGENKVASWYQSSIALLITHDNKSKWSSFLRYQLAMPFIADLAENLQAVEIKTQHQDETTNSFFAISPSFRIKKNQSRGQYLAHQKIGDVGYVKDSADITLDVKPQQQVGKVNAQLVINLPKQMTAVKIAKPDFLKESYEHSINVQLLAVEGGSIPSYQFKVSAPNFVNMIAVFDDGRELLPRQKTFENDAWILYFPLSREIAHFEVLVATEVELINYDFELQPSYEK